MVAEGVIIPADDLLTGGFSNRLIVSDTEARHVDPHIGGRFIGAYTGDLLKNSVQHRKDLHIPVVVDGRLSIGIQMEGVDHVDVVQIRRSRLVGQIDRML